MLFDMMLETILKEAYSRAIPVGNEVMADSTRYLLKKKRKN